MVNALTTPPQSGSITRSWSSASATSVTLSRIDGDINTGTHMRMQLGDGTPLKGVSFPSRPVTSCTYRWPDRYDCDVRGIPRITLQSIEVADSRLTTCFHALETGYIHVANESWYTGGREIRWTATLGGDYIYDHEVSPAERIRSVIKHRLFPSIASRRHLPRTADERELRARETLRSVIGEQRWRRFIRDGFITVHSRKDGRTYQIHPGHGTDYMTCVYERGVMIERLCCYLNGSFPPTDHLLSRFLLILNDPEEFRRLSNPFAARRREVAIATETDLVAEFRRLKGTRRTA